MSALACWQGLHLYPSYMPSIQHWYHWADLQNGENMKKRCVCVCVCVSACVLCKLTKQIMVQLLIFRSCFLLVVWVLKAEQSHSKWPSSRQTNLAPMCVWCSFLLTTLTPNTDADIHTLELIANADGCIDGNVYWISKLFYGGNLYLVNGCLRDVKLSSRTPKYPPTSIFLTVRDLTILTTFDQDAQPHWGCGHVRCRRWWIAKSDTSTAAYGHALCFTTCSYKAYVKYSVSCRNENPRYRPPLVPGDALWPHLLVCATPTNLYFFSNSWKTDPPDPWNMKSIWCGLNLLYYKTCLNKSKVKKF